MIKEKISDALWPKPQAPPRVQLVHELVQGFVQVLCFPLASPTCTPLLSNHMFSIALARGWLCGNVSRKNKKDERARAFKALAGA